MPGDTRDRRFRRIAAAGILFQGGAAATDTATVISALVHGLSGSAFAVGAAAAIARYGWLFPQLVVGYLAERATRRMPFYMVGAFGRVACLAAVCAVLVLARELSVAAAVAAFFVAWTAYAFVAGIVAVPYNDIVARAVPSERRSRLLAARFFGGGLLAFGVASAARAILASGIGDVTGYAFVLGLGAGLLLLSAISFVAAGEPETPATAPPSSFGGFLRSGAAVVRRDRRFRLFLLSRWFGGLVVMAVPFYVVRAGAAGAGPADVPLFLAAQTAGALLANPLWGWWGDRRGKRSLLELVAALGAVAPALALLLSDGLSREALIAGFVGVFFVLGAVGNGDTIAQLGYLMEISPDERRPAYSGFFNVLAAPAALLPLLGAAVAEGLSFTALFAVALAAAALQYASVRRLRAAEAWRPA
ncbi:MAG: MFS transporter [Proteobacteria bacterium]|nr:MFS transporter [Pseudomonadota bacterium]